MVANEKQNFDIFISGGFFTSTLKLLTVILLNTQFIIFDSRKLE